jgi:hypothetical protein
MMHNPRTYYCVARIVEGQPPEYISATADEERAYSHLNRLRKQGQTSIGMVELDRKPPGVKPPPKLRKQQQGALFGGEPPDDPQGSLFNPARGLTAKQLEALDQLQREGPKSSWHFGSTTVNRLRKAGLVEDVMGQGGSRQLQITEEGLDRLVRGNPAPEYADDELVFEYGVVKNKNERQGGWLPAVWQNGRLLGSEWSTISYDRDEALQMAPREADEAAERYIGDWDITMKPRSNPGRASEAHYATSRRSRERERLYTTLTLLGGTVYRDSTPIAFWAGPGDGGPNEGYRPHPGADESERETLVEFNQFRGYSTNPAITAEERHELPSADFAVPDHEGLPIDTPGRTRAAMARFNQYEFDHKQQQKKAYRRILARARRFAIDPQGFQARWVGSGR